MRRVVYCVYMCMCCVHTSFIALIIQMSICHQVLLKPTPTPVGGQVTQLLFTLLAGFLAVGHAFACVCVCVCVYVGRDLRPVGAGIGGSLWGATRCMYVCLCGGNCC